MNHLHILITILDDHDRIYGSEPLTASLLKELLQDFHNQVEREKKEQEEEDDMLEGYLDDYGDRD
jgi:hypothetical protein